VIAIVVGARGADVGAVQQALIEAGETIDLRELRDAYFGLSTRTAVLDFQSNHVDANGRPLRADGVVGDITRLALANPREPVESFIADGWSGDLVAAPNDEARAAVSVAITQVGFKEDPKTPNWGPEVSKYGQRFDDDTKQYQPWCAYFVSWAWAQAPLGSPFGIRASALKIRDWGMANSALLGTANAILPGDIGIILRAKGRGHVEIVAGLEHDGQLSLVGGNVANAVRATVRPRSAFANFVRPLR
jgi:hypothetical protein